ncbi:NADH-quinone oxidoreductase subunit N [Parasegetibacter sp. NRK P23]|uniref:NADH-quinone oxidoreductase subunit N n=1 Tax=Parasegetibacter sp. NRK P23 TaxID=2942999 RepID=UPI0020447FAB|nr:NADH-quinone oxidoreductase subunit N [Parasegetibacter sp. NRK P23]MCM5527379.1 NADH-quinone oxidoreductase subunit N [Parasegetibacter sp. NRK P23]
MNAIIISAIWGVIMMFGGLFLKQSSAIRSLAIAGLLVLLGANVWETYHSAFLKIDTHGMLDFGRFGLFFNTIAFAATLVYVLLSGNDITKVGNKSNAADYFALIFFILAGVGIVSSFGSLLMLFLGIEIISIPLYVLAGSDKKNLKSNEASLKYFLMGAFSTGIMLMGIALIYGAKGTFFIDTIAIGAGKLTPLMASGLILLLISMAFKVSAAPFHFWTPDVYDGSPTVFTSFMATIVKAAAFIGFVRLFERSFGAAKEEWQLLVAIITAATLIIGNVTAVFQQSVKRMLAYSSIAQAGFMMFAIFTLNDFAKEGIILYAAAYSLATIGIFAVLIRMKDYTFEGFNGLAKSNPLLAAVITIFLLSLAGIPLTAGFFAKYYMLTAAIKSGTYFWLVIVAIVCAAISVYYYFRVIQAMYFREGDAEVGPVSGGFKALLLVVAGIIVLIGVWPQLLLNYLYF